MKSKEDFIGFDKHEYNPIIRLKSEELLRKIVREKHPKSVLEIGTYLGYSAAVIMEEAAECFVTSIEKNAQNANDAVLNLNELGYAGRFEIICCDAIDFLNKNKDKQYDFIFLDGPKGQYINYLPILKKMLRSGGVLIADDILFYGLVGSKEKIVHKHRSIVEHLRKFLQELKQDKDFETTIYEFEDGISVSIKKWVLTVKVLCDKIYYIWRNYAFYWF